MWDNGIDIIPEEETFYTEKHLEAIPKHVKNEYCAWYWRFPVIKPKSVPNNNQFSSTLACRSGEPSYDVYDLCSGNEEYIMPNNVAETMPGRSNSIVHWSIAAVLWMNLTPQSPKHGGQRNSTRNDYLSGWIEFSSA